MRPQHGGPRDTQTQIGVITETPRPMERNVHTWIHSHLHTCKEEGPVHWPCGRDPNTGPGSWGRMRETGDSSHRTATPAPGKALASGRGRGAWRGVCLRVRTHVWGCLLHLLLSHLFIPTPRWGRNCRRVGRQSLPAFSSLSGLPSGSWGGRNPRPIPGCG